MKNIRIGIIGAGSWAAMNHIPVLKSFPGVDVAGICGLGAENLRRVQDRFGIPFSTEDYEELLHHCQLDGAVISSPHHLHYVHARAALEQGCHVLCEKPMATTTEEAWHLADLAKERNLEFLIPYGWNYTDFAQAAKCRVGAGEIGRIEYVQCHMTTALRDLFSGTGASWAKGALLEPQMKTWSDPAGGGGYAHGQLTHALGLLLYITGLQPEMVFALTSTSPTGADLYNAATCRFKGGAIGVLGGAATQPEGSARQLDISVFGSDGMLLLDIERPRLELRRNDGQNFSMPITDDDTKYQCIEPLRTFAALIRGEAVENRSTASLGARVVELLDALLRSAHTGREIVI